MFNLQDAINIAASYNITDLKLVQEEFEHAIEIAKTYPKSAEQYFDGYMADTTAYEYADSKAVAQFEDMAYGRD